MECDGSGAYADGGGAAAAAVSVAGAETPYVTSVPFVATN